MAANELADMDSDDIQAGAAFYDALSAEELTTTPNLELPYALP